MNTTAETVPSTAPFAKVANARGRRRLSRRIGAVLAGLLAIFAVTTATDVVMHLAGVFPPMAAAPMSGPLFLLAFAYRFVFDVAGSYLTARLAPDRPMQHALALGGVGLCISVAAAVAMRHAGPSWYSIGLALSALPCAWLGARLRGAR